jgi:hypothetical protein
MSDKLLVVFLYVGCFVFFLSVISAGLIKRFAQQLTLKEGFFIGLLAYAVSTVLLVVYFVAKPVFQIPTYLDGLTTVVWMCLAGIIITRQAGRYGVEKTGYLGVGAKTMLSVLVLSWVLVAIYAVFALMSK